jgi:CheY-like chemotaxis protein
MPERKTVVMVVDDEPAMCNILKRILTAEGYRAIIAGNGEEALELFTQHKPDVVLLDLMMPGISGQDVCRKIKKSSPETQVIYLSAKVSPIVPQDEHDVSIQADAVLPKPATSQKILSTIEKVLR